MRARFLLIVLSGAVLNATVVAETGDDSLKGALAGHAETVQGIRTLYCKHMVKHEYADGRVTTSAPTEYWRSGENFRAKWAQNGASCDVVVCNLREESICKAAANPKPAISIGNYTGSALGVTDPWENALLIFSPNALPKTLLVPFQELVKRNKVNGVEKVLRGQTEVIVVDLQWETASRRFTLDPRLNFLISRIESSTAKSRSVVDVQKSKEVAPGIFFPETIVTKSFNKDDLIVTKTATFSEIRVNAPIPDSTFRLTYPPNAQVNDYLQNKQFTTDAAGRIAGPGTEIPKPPPLKSTSSGMRTETKTEPTNWSALVMPISGGILTTGVGLWGAKRWGKRKSSP
jgi:hypothetical protein